MTKSSDIIESNFKTWQGLTLEEKCNIIEKCSKLSKGWDDFEFANMIEIALKEKNASNY